MSCSSLGHVACSLYGDFDLLPGLSMNQPAFLDFELCLSRRTDLVNSVVGQVLESRLPGWRPEHLSVVAHAVDTDVVVKLRFLIASDGAVEQQRRTLIVAGELMLDEVFSKSPWESPPLVAESSGNLPARLEIYAKCGSTDEHLWFERCGIPETEVALLRSMTALLRGLRLDGCRLKSVLPLLVLRVYSARTGSPHLNLGGGVDTPLPSRRQWLEQRVSELRARGLLSKSGLDVTRADMDALHNLECYVVETARALGLSPTLVVRWLLRQLGFRDIERDYLMTIGLELRDQ
jgi:hypothetical protein